MESKICIQCDIEFFKKVNCSKKDWINTKFCSKKCVHNYKRGKTVYNSGQFKKGQQPLYSFQNGNIPWNKGLKGIHLSPETEFKKGENCGEDHRLWKGDDAGIKPIHQWVVRHRGKPNECEHCGATSEQRVLDWANIDHTYKRTLEDYLSLCRSCHRNYDIKYNNYRRES